MKLTVGTAAAPREVLGGDVVTGQSATGGRAERERRGEQKSGDHERLIDVLAEAVAADRFHTEDRAIRARGEAARRINFWDGGSGVS
jgi:hypothetical protein